MLNRHLSTCLAVAHPRGLRRDEGKPVVGRTSLTAREQEIAALIAEGLSNQQIGLRLFISENTVKTYTKRVYRKLDVHSKQDIIDLCREG